MTRKTRLTTAITAGVLAVGVVTGAGVGLGLPDEHAPLDASARTAFDTAEGPRISALDAPQTSDAAELAGRFQQSALLESVGLLPAGIRLAARTDAGSVFVGPTDRGWTCVIYVAGGAAPGSSCLPTAWLKKQPLTVEVIAGGTAIRAGIVPDGYHTIELSGANATLSGNGFIIAGNSDGGALTAIGTDKPTLRQVLAPLG